MTNRLALERSPYLQQHAENPVDWYPWGPEALARARTENKPILLSIGYSACHWCHVMAHESFEDEAVAAFMNSHFVNIKVDREERPDVDSIYMEAVQALTGSGGWPLNVFLTPDGRPFYGGTYFPPAQAHGRPSWLQVLEGIAATFQERGEDIEHNATILTRLIQDAQTQGAGDDEVDETVLRDAYQGVVAQFDPVDGGFGSAPKFPQPLGLEFVLRMYSRYREPAALNFFTTTLDRMADGGIYDQLGGGFHRYSVDGVWLVPHFEKMLYDNALLARLFTLAFTATGVDRYRQTAEETLDYLLRDLSTPNGAFFAAQDADSEGVEGKFYLWTPDELRSVLGDEDGRLLTVIFGIGAPHDTGESRYILRRTRPLDEVADETGKSRDYLERLLNRSRQTLFDARRLRVAPATDTKVIAGWNALAVRAFALAGRVFDRPDYLRAAERTMQFVLTDLRPTGQLMRHYNDGPGTVPAFLEDYAFCVEALIDLSMTAFDTHFLEAAVDLANEMLERFWDRATGAFFDTAAGAEELVVRPRSLFDNPIPSGNSAACFALLKLEALGAGAQFRTPAENIFRSSRKLLTRAPMGFPYALCALDFYLSTPAQLAVAGDPASADTRALAQTAFEAYLPDAVVSVGLPESSPLLVGRTLARERATAYLCENFACRLPVTEPAELARQLSQLDRTVRGNPSR